MADRDTILTLDHYQTLANRTNTGSDLTILALGIAGEAGEVADEIKKVYGQGHVLDPQKMADELGDVLWYIAAMAQELGVSLEAIARMNVEKLRKRYPDGFSEERSRNRGE